MGGGHRQSFWTGWHCNGGSVGIGFAIPANQVQNIVAELKSDGKVDRGWLGVQLQDINEDLADGLGLPSRKGALIADVLTGSPAERAGIEVGGRQYRSEW